MKVSELAKSIMLRITELRHNASSGFKSALEFVQNDIDIDNAIVSLSNELGCTPDQIWVDSQGIVINLAKAEVSYLKAIRQTLVRTQAKFILKKLEGKTSRYAERKLKKAEYQLAYIDGLLGG